MGLARASIVLLLFVSVSADQWTPATYPNPSTPSGAAACGRRAAKSSVCDPDGIISPESANVIEGTIKDIENAVDPYARDGCTEHSSDLPGFQVAVALVKKMQVVAKPPDGVAADFAAQLFDAWGVGDAKCGNGVLMFLSVEDKQVYILAGRQALSVAPKERLNSVIVNMRPLLRKGDYNMALEHAIVDLGVVLAGGDVKPPQEGADYWGLALFMGIFSSVVGFASWTTWKSRGEQKRCNALLEKLKREQSTAVSTGRYPAASCPICFEDFEKEDTGAPSAPPLGALKGNEFADEGSTGVEASAPLLTRRRSKSRENLVGGAGPSAEKACSTSEGEHRRPLELPCGHTFCEPCISSWLESHTSCPICRGSVGGEIGTSQTLASQERRYEPDMYADELRFRMGALHRLYPTWISPEMVTHASDAVHRGQCISWASVRQAQLQSDVRQQHMSSGLSGGGHSFGGGSHSGGGGIGGSW